MPGHISQKLAERCYPTGQPLSNEASVLPPSENCCPILLSIKAAGLPSERPFSEGWNALVLPDHGGAVVREGVRWIKIILLFGGKFKKSK